MRAAVLLCAVLGGCAYGEPLGVPPLTPVGSGLPVERTAIPVAFPTAPDVAPNSLFGRRSLDLLTDVRAKNVGDTLTVLVEINDRASFFNESDREREADVDLNFINTLSATGFDGVTDAAGADFDTAIGSGSEFRGSGAIDRRERLRILFAVVVTEVLGNGNLVISGTQEVRVNAEVRVLQLSGILNPLDVNRNNTVSYDKIAEARISYGGRGRISEVQAPNWGQQIYDKVVPF